MRASYAPEGPLAKVSRILEGTLSRRVAKPRPTARVASPSWFPGLATKLTLEAGRDDFTYRIARASAFAFTRTFRATPPLS